jgi:hypothetical protein
MTQSKSKSLLYYPPDICEPSEVSAKVERGGKKKEGR